MFAEITLFPPFLACSQNSRLFPLSVAQKIAKFASFLRNSFSVPTFVACVCQNHAYSHLLLHVRRNHVYSLHTQSIKEFLRFCEKPRKLHFFAAEVHPWGAPGGRGGLAKRFKVASPRLSRNPRGFGLPAYGCCGPSRAGMCIRTATPRVPKGAWPPLPGSTPRGSP